jgi:hypothetical protein
MKHSLTLVHTLIDKPATYEALKIPVRSMEDHYVPEKSEYEALLMEDNQFASFRETRAAQR